MVRADFLLLEVEADEHHIRSELQRVTETHPKSAIPSHLGTG